jgi:arylsulfatase A-like enzyme
MQWLERHYKEEFFLYVDTWDPHEPWDPPKHYAELYWPGHDGVQAPPIYGYWQDVPGMTQELLDKGYASYCGEVTMVDTWFGYMMRMVENLGLMENTAIIFTSDHGYYFGEHGGLYGKMVLGIDRKTGKPISGLWSRSPYYEEVTRIPLLIYLPGGQKAIYNGMTSAIDLMPTVMEIMGQEIPSWVEGRSLLSKMRDLTLPGRDFVVSAAPFVNGGDMVRQIDDIRRETEKDSTATITTADGWALLYDTEPGGSELYDLNSDLKQEKNVIGDYPDKAREIHQLFVKFMRETDLAPRMLEPRLELRM